jgi:hypothetical protein
VRAASVLRNAAFQSESEETEGQEKPAAKMPLSRKMTPRKSHNAEKPNNIERSETKVTIFVIE